MSSCNAESVIEAALNELGNGSFPEAWKSTIIHAAAIISRFVTPDSPYVEHSKRVLSSMATIGANGILEPGWDSSRAEMASILIALLQDVKSGSLWRGIWDAKNDTCDDVLQQADELLEAKYFAAAAVLAGGALESHLKDLCDRYEIKWNGDGSISIYQGALSKAQKENKIAFFSKSDGKLVTAWGGTRNDAAHRPTSILPEDSNIIKNMINGVRDFIDRVP